MQIPLLFLFKYKSALHLVLNNLKLNALNLQLTTVLENDLKLSYSQQSWISQHIIVKENAISGTGFNYSHRNCSRISIRDFTDELTNGVHYNARDGFL